MFSTILDTPGSHASTDNTTPSYHRWRQGPPRAPCGYPQRFWDHPGSLQRTPRSSPGLPEGRNRSMGAAFHWTLVCSTNVHWYAPEGATANFEVLVWSTYNSGIWASGSPWVNICISNMCMHICTSNTYMNVCTFNICMNIICISNVDSPGAPKDPLRTPWDPSWGSGGIWKPWHALFGVLGQTWDVPGTSLGVPGRSLWGPRGVPERYE